MLRLSTFLADICLFINRRIITRNMSDSDNDNNYNNNDDDDNNDNNGNQLLAEGQFENGHLPSSDSGEHDGDDDDDDDDDLNQMDQFDLDLPTSHRYLGKLDDVSGYVYYEDGEILTLIGIQTNTLVFPGFNLPLVINNDLEINMLQRYTQHKKVFVLLTPDVNFQGIYPYGVIMEIFQFHLRSNSLYLKARCRQRCKLIINKNKQQQYEIKQLIGEMFEVTIKILNEPNYKTPLIDTQLLSLKQRRQYKSENSDDFFTNRNFIKYRKYHCCQYNLPIWLYDKYELCILTKYLRERLFKYYLINFIPNDPIQLSYWFIQNFQLKHTERLKLMAFNTTFERLRYELKLINMKRLICCGNCSAEIARQSNVFPMSRDGVQSNYCNPNGFVYETVTVTKAKNITLVGRPSTQFSWFPGYAWTIIQCKFCNSHLGWKFTSQKLKPEHFFGLAKSGFDVKIISENDNDDN